jgi:hypothetical protein
VTVRNRRLAPDSPISYKANRMIRGKSPSDYLTQLQTDKSVTLNDAGVDAILRSHFIDPAFLRAHDSEGYIES